MRCGFQVLIVASLTATAGCGPQRLVNGGAVTSDATLPPAARVVVLAPALRVQSAATGEAQPPLRYGRAALEESMQRAALRAGGSAAIDCAGDPSGAAAACTTLDPHASLLAQGVLREPAGSGLRSAHEKGVHAILAHAIHVRSPDAVWDGSMWKYRAARPAYTLYAALIETGKGAVLWRNQVLVRALPGFGGADGEALRLLYDRFPVRSDP